MNASSPDVARIASLVGDPARANILQALMDGRALTAKELAWIAGVAPQTASGHLALLLDGGLVAVAAQGRHRYFRLAGPQVATVLEGLMVLSGGQPARRLPSRAGEALARGRTCYDHFAGRLGVAIHDALVAANGLAVEAGGYRLTDRGYAIFARLGIETATTGRRAPLRPCLDWSERRPHLAGALAAALACRCYEAAWVERRRDSRAVTLTPDGAAALAKALPGFACEPCEAPVTRFASEPARSRA